MGYIARLFWIFVPCAIFFAACTKDIKIDASSDASLRKSLINMSRDMSENEINDFNNAIYGIIELVTNSIPKSETRTDIAIKKVRAKLGKPVALLLDTKGPEIRIGKFADPNGIELKAGDVFIFVFEDID